MSKEERIAELEAQVAELTERLEALEAAPQQQARPDYVITREAHQTAWPCGVDAQSMMRELAAEYGTYNDSEADWRAGGTFKFNGYL
jgi:primosomal protein N''